MQSLIILIYFMLLLVSFSVLVFLYFFKMDNLVKLKSLIKLNLKDLFGLDYNFMMIGSSFSFFVFFFIFSYAFVGYFSYSLALLGLMYFTFFIASISWLSTLINFFKMESFQKYITKFGESFFQTLFMLPIELASEFSRPFSLTIRLSVNVLVGHFLSKGVYMMIFFFGLNTSLVFIFAVLLEMFVFLVQSFVFSILLIIYLSE